MMKTNKKLLKFIGIMIVAISFFIIPTFGCGPSPATGRIIKACAELGDDSDWMEVACYDKYSLIVRLDCLPDKIQFNKSGKYEGYLNSKVKELLDGWFKGLNESSLLKKYAVGNTAELNLGFFEGGNKYDCNGFNELQGNGFSLPDENQEPSAFPPSFQEVRKFLFSREGELVTFANNRILLEYNEEHNKGLKYLWNYIPVGYGSKPIESSWSRTVSASDNKIDNFGPYLFFVKSEEFHGVRPAIWINSSVFQEINPSYRECKNIDTCISSLKSDISDKEIILKVKNLLSYELHYKKVKNLSKYYDRNKYCILFTGDPSKKFIKNLSDAYYKAGIITENKVTVLGESDMSALSDGDFDQLLEHTVERAKNGTLCVNAQKTVGEVNSRFEKFINELISGNCLVIMTNCSPQLKQYIDDSCNGRYFETLDCEETLNKKDRSSFKSHKLTIEECLQPLNALVGMNDFKEHINSLIRQFKVYQDDLKLNIEEAKPPILHMALMGNPGTGKTTAANMLGEIFFNAGIIKKNIVVKAERADLIGKYQGHTEAFVKDKLKEAEGGILFLDEAYSLASGGKEDFGSRAIEGLLTPLTTNQCVIIAAGYTKEMNELFFPSNSGLTGRFEEKIIFPDYTNEELTQIVENLFKKSKLILEEGARDCLFRIFEDIPRNSNFSNARYACKVYDAIMRVRSMNLPIDIDINSITEEEIQQRRTITCEYITKAKEKLEK